MIQERSIFGRSLEIAVLCGGVSAERDVSFHSGAAVGGALRRRGHRVMTIKVGDRRVADLDSFEGDAAFIALHGCFGEDGGIQKILERRGIAYTGSGPAASRIAMDKAASKETFQLAGIPTPSWTIVPPHMAVRDAIRHVGEVTGLPAVLKPLRGGSSIGVEIAHSREELARRLEGQRDESLLVEEYLPGRELTVSILGEEALPIVELRPARSFFDYEAKYTNAGTEYGNAASLGPTVYRRVQEIGLAAHGALGCRAFSRVDLILPEKGEPTVLEVNTIPGLTEKSLQPKAAGMVGIDFGDLCEKMIAMALPAADETAERRQR
ncbi:MAG: D-alanine--D-alanine ligase [Planctomycetota bacterium]|nr:D-alanine--D-alanine ligase [Planctomycetota bacterium]